MLIVQIHVFWGTQNNSLTVLKLRCGGGTDTEQGMVLRSKTFEGQENFAPEMDEVFHY